VASSYFVGGWRKVCLEDVANGVREGIDKICFPQYCEYLVLRAPQSPTVAYILVVDLLSPQFRCSHTHTEARRVLELNLLDSFFSTEDA